ncbi:unnamed protein product (macronuclear) [Paramecium tetraurelia]|uniref:EGF-like domain-containing protein n=1 Tax=Paramecium tetraurelia TaxID=5888 RepID=A0BLE5_PARTE|nr:uncharacterized protein GSPATT00029995001 [Paramecium tetraurelia]CAK59362.1 unnamed protein product [Paramecium tetraurelia]|eukprot:XP_001426760.1 hypothetical protein (macronuclear) [Paramecium tetraurelia strain d4-2]
MNKVLIASILLIGVLGQSSPPLDCTYLSCLATGAMKVGQSTRQAYQCMNGYYWAGQSCQPCQPIEGGFYQCTDYYQTGALTCSPGWTQLNGICVNMPDGCLSYSLNSNGNAYVCGKCDSGFSLIAGVCVENQGCTVYSSTRYVCTQCSAGYHLNWDYIPSVSSSSDYYYNYFDGFCSPCAIAGCQNCPSANTCTQCIGGYFWSFSGLTTGSATDGSGTCQRCLDYCTSCTNSTNCTSCADGYYISQVNGITTCASCLPSLTCTKCQNGTSCLACASGYQLIGQTTCQKLPDGCTQMDSNQNCTSCVSIYVLNTQTPKTCTPCGTGCASCTINSTTVSCTKCQEFYYAVKDGSGIVTCSACSSYPQSTGWLRCGGPQDTPSYTTVQVTQCVDGYFLVNITTNGVATPTCIAAVQIQACLTLTNTSTNSNNVCATCVKNFGAYEGGTCLSCPPQAGAKTQLSSQCNKCGGSSSTPISCTGCSQKYFLQAASSASSATCATCSASGGCLECSSNTTCTKCNTGYYLSGAACQPCQTNCASCDNSTTCKACMDGYFQYSGIKTAQATCVACQFGCATCASPGQVCLTCIDGYVFQQGGCVPLNQANCALKLSSTLSTDKPYSSSGCSICKYGFHMIQNRCFQSVQPYAGYAYGQTTNVSTDLNYKNDTIVYAQLLVASFIMLVFTL